MYNDQSCDYLDYLCGVRLRIYGLERLRVCSEDRERFKVEDI